jgi:hypothetical protein
MSNHGGWSVLRVACTVLALPWLGLAQAPAREQGKEEAARLEKVTLQYRVARDAFAPSKFLAVVDGGISAPLELTWDLPQPQSKQKEEAQAARKKQFDDLIKKLEAEQINGVEFECRGEWLEKGLKLRVTSVPELTEAGKRRLQESGR